MKITVNNFNSIREQSIFDIQTAVEMGDIPPELVFNWDQTGISIVPGSSWTMELKGVKRVEIAGISDKRQITAVLCGTMAGDFSPPQLIYQGKTIACLPQYKFPDNWHITCTTNHRSNEETMINYIKTIIIPYVQQNYYSVCAAKNQTFTRTSSLGTVQWPALEENNIIAVPIPANCTDRL